MVVLSQLYQADCAWPARSAFLQRVLVALWLQVARVSPYIEFIYKDSKLHCV